MGRTVNFDIISNEEFERGFLNIISHSSKDNTYKFAFARFLLDYSRDNVETHVEFHTIAEYFLEYYWTQICKLKMKHAPQTAKKPLIVTIIEKEFTKMHYSDTFKEICQKEPEKIQRCVEQIREKCFHDVTWRFQRIRVSKATQVRLFFDYEIKRKVHSNKKRVDLDYGINLNLNAIKFFKRYNAVLLKAVILEWAKFLEELNVGLPKIIIKTEGRDIKRRSTAPYRKMLVPLFKECFYCKEQLSMGSDTHVEHVMPFHYILGDDIWNLTLACQRCNMKKLGALPPMEYINKLIERNRDYQTRIPKLEKSLTRLGHDFEILINNHYANAKSQGFMIIENFP